MRKAGSARADTARAALALGRVIDETRALFHRLRLTAERLHEADHLSAGERAVLIELSTHGPRTVPAMARARPVSRQHIQALVNVLLKRTLVVLVENPRHQRSRLVELTREGRALVKTVRKREERVLTRLGRETNPEALEQVAEMLGHVRKLFEGSTRGGIQHRRPDPRRSTIR